MTSTEKYLEVLEKQKNGVTAEDLMSLVGYNDKKFVGFLWRRAVFWAKILHWMPGVEAIFLSGSLPASRAKKTSDIDFFIVTNPGSIFTARFFVVGFLKLFGVLASDKQHDQQICPNHFVTSDNLEILEKNAYSADLFSQNIFLSGNENLWRLFVLANQDWVQDFGENFSEASTSLRHRGIHGDERDFNELIFDYSKIGILEKILKKFQIRRVEKNRQNLPKTACVKLEDQEIRLHPNPKSLTFTKS